MNAGGPSGAQALIAAGATSVGARGAGNWLTSRGFAWATKPRITVVAVILVMLALVAVILGPAERVLYRRMQPPVIERLGARSKRAQVSHRK